MLPLAALLLGGCDLVPTSGSSGSAERPVASQDVPSCYRAAGINVEPAPPTRAVFVLIDQTTGVDGTLRKGLRENVERLLAPGTAFMIASFSAFSKGHHATTLARGVLENAVPEAERGDLPATRLQDLDQCLIDQKAFGAKQAEQIIRKAVTADVAKFSNSEVLSSLTQLSKAVRAAEADEKIVIVVSDLLEHSKAASFYTDRDLRLIDPEAELAKAEELGLVGDFGGATVYVIGAGLLSPESGDDTLRDTRALKALADFWTSWFEKSGAQVGEYGQPELVNPIAWAKTEEEPEVSPGS